MFIASSNVRSNATVGFTRIEITLTIMAPPVSIPTVITPEKAENRQPKMRERIISSDLAQYLFHLLHKRSRGCGSAILQRNYGHSALGDKLFVRHPVDVLFTDESKRTFASQG